MIDWRPMKAQGLIVSRTWRQAVCCRSGHVQRSSHACPRGRLFLEDKAGTMTGIDDIPCPAGPLHTHRLVRHILSRRALARIFLPKLRPHPIPLTETP